MKELPRNIVKASALVLLLAASACGIDVTTVPDMSAVGISAQSPTGLTVSTADPYGITLSWKDKSSIETGFWINRKTGKNDYKRIGMAVAESMLYQDSTVLTDTTYTYQIDAVQGQVVLGASNEVTTWIPTYRMTEIQRFGLSTSPSVFGVDTAGVVVDQPGDGLRGYRYKPKRGTFEKRWVYADLNGSSILQIIFKKTRMWILYSGKPSSIGGRQTKFLKKLGLSGDKNEPWLFVRYLYRSSPRTFDWVNSQTIALLPIKKIDADHFAADSSGPFLYFSAESAAGTNFCKLDIHKVTTTTLNCQKVKGVIKAHTLLMVRPDYDTGKEWKTTFFFVSSETANYAVSLTNPVYDWTIDSVVPGAPTYTHFNYMNGVTWARDTEGQFYRFTTIAEFVEGKGELVDFGLSLNPDLYQEAFQLAPTRIMVMGCELGLFIFNEGFRKLSSFGLPDCPIGGGLVGRTPVYLNRDNEIVRKQLHPRIENR